jgi:hypothetical protein
MDTFNFLSVLFSVVIGLAITEILQGFRRLILARRHVTIFWPALIWAGLMIVIVSQAWWGMFGMRSFREWNMAMYSIVVLQITLMYLSAGVVVPEVPKDGPLDMRAAYFRNSRWFFGLLAATVASTFLKDYITIGHISSSWNAYFLELYFTVSVIAAWTRRPWFHWLLAPVSVLAIVTYAFLLSYRL